MKLQNSFTVPAPVERAWEVLLDLERVAPCLPGAELDAGDGREYEGRMAIKIGPVTSRYAGTVRIEEADAGARRSVMRAQARDSRGAGTAAATIATEMHATPGGTRVDVETDIQISGPAAQFGRGVMQEVSSKLMERFAECLAAEMAVARTGPGGGDATAAGAVGAGAAGPTNGGSAGGPDGAWSAERGARWAAAPGARAPTQLGGYDETPVGRLPTGPAGDAALAAAEAASPVRARPLRPRPSDDVLDLGEISRGAVLRRLVPAAALLAAAIAGTLAWRARRRR